MAQSNPTWRERDILLAGVAGAFAGDVDWQDTRPNKALFTNPAAAPLYLSRSPLVSAANFELQIPAGATRAFSRPDPLVRVFMFSTAAVAPTIHVMSVDEPFILSDIMQTMDTAGPGAGMVPVSVNAFTVALPAGANNIGDVDVLSLPALPAGANNIGDVDVLSLPALPAGGNNIGDVDIASVPLSSKNWAAEATGDAYVVLHAADPDGGVWDKRGTDTGMLEVANTDGANGMHYKVEASIDNVRWHEIVGETLLAAGDFDFVALTVYYPYLRLQIKSSVAGNPATAVAAGASLAS